MEEPEEYEYPDVEVVEEPEEEIPASRELENPNPPETFVGNVGEGDEEDDDEETTTKKEIEEAVLKNEIVWSVNGCSVSVRSAFQNLNECEDTATRLIKLFKVKIPSYFQ